MDTCTVRSSRLRPDSWAARLAGLPERPFLTFCGGFDLPFAFLPPPRPGIIGIPGPFPVERPRGLRQARRVMRTAQAAVLEAFNAPLRVHTYTVPERVEPGAVLVRTEMAGICGTDVHLWQGQLPIKLPVILGHETVGRIAELGEGVTKDWSGQPLQVGDRVTWNSATSCGKCYYCAQKRQPTRCPHRRAYGIGYRCDQSPHFLGGYADFHYLRPGATIFKLPDELPTEAVVGAGCALITAIHGVERTGIAWRDNVVEALSNEPVDLVLLLVLANSVQNAMVGSDVSLVGGFAAAATLLILTRLLHLAEARFSWLRRSVEGEPLLLVRHGTVSRSAMARAGMSTDDLALAARRFGIASIQQIELAILEADGEVSVIGASNRAPRRRRAVQVRAPKRARR